MVSPSRPTSSGIDSSSLYTGTTMEYFSASMTYPVPTRPYRRPRASSTLRALSIAAPDLWGVTSKANALARAGQIGLGQASGQKILVPYGITRRVLPGPRGSPGTRLAVQAGGQGRWARSISETPGQDLT